MKAPRLTDDHTGERIENFRARMMVFVALGLLLVVAGLLLYAKDYISVGAVRVWLLLTPFVLYAVSSLLLRVTAGAGTGLARVLYAAGGERHSREYSGQQALIVSGRIGEAIDSFRAHLVAFPEDVEARLRLASLYAGAANQPEAAEALLEEARLMTLSPRQELVIGNTLIDLYRRNGQREPLKAELARFARMQHGTEAGELARRHLRHLVEEDHRVS
jgi:hypothetical protein